MIGSLDFKRSFGFNFLQIYRRPPSEESAKQVRTWSNVSKVCYASADVAASSAGSLHALDAYYFLAPFSC